VIQQIWNDLVVWVQYNWPTIVTAVVAGVLVYLRGAYREKMAQIIGDIVTLLVKQMTEEVTNTSDEQLRSYAYAAYDRIDALLQQVKAPWAGKLNFLYKMLVPREKFAQWVVSAVRKYTLRETVIETRFRVLSNVNNEAYAAAHTLDFDIDLSDGRLPGGQLSGSAEKVISATTQENNAARQIHKMK